MDRVEKNVVPWLGKKTINTSTPPHLLEVTRRIEGGTAAVSQETTKIDASKMPKANGVRSNLNQFTVSLDSGQQLP